MRLSGTARTGFWAWLHLDPWLSGLILLLAGVGLATVYSATGGNVDMLTAQAQRMGVGLAALLMVARCPPAWFHGLALPAYGVCVLLLLAVELVGTEVNGAQRWLDLGGLRLQPSELMKILLPLALAAVLAPARWPLGWGALFIGLLMLSIPAWLILNQPDLGTALMVVVPGLLLLFLAGIRWRLLLLIGGTAMAALPALWFSLREYQRARVLTLFNPEADPRGAGYHILQSKIAIGSGGWSGKGWQEGTQARLDFLPEAHTDFIFAVFAEEHGFIGVLFLLLLYVAICGRGLMIAAQSSERFGRLLASTLSLTMFIYVFVNMGMVSGILPVVGIPLPLLSFGGSAILSMAVGLGLIMSVHAHRRTGLL